MAASKDNGWHILVEAMFACVLWRIITFAFGMEDSSSLIQGRQQGSVILTGKLLYFDMELIKVASEVSKNIELL